MEKKKKRNNVLRKLILKSQKELEVKRLVMMIKIHQEQIYYYQNKNQKMKKMYRY